MTRATPIFLFRFGLMMLAVLVALRVDASDPSPLGKGDVCAPKFALMIPPPHPTLAKLERAFKNSEISSHRLEIREGRGIVTVHYLNKNDQEAMCTLREAVSSGLISELHIGQIEGPKVLDWVVRVMDSVPKDQPMTITGSFRMNALDATRWQEHSNWQLAPDGLAAKGKDWPESAMRAFDQALGRLGVHRACRDLYRKNDLRSCRYLEFRIDTSSENPVQWSR